MRFLYLYVGGLFYLCAVVLFAFALNASLETSGLFLTEMFPTWLASALIALALALASHGSTLRLRPAEAGPPERWSSPHVGA
jgi:ABC-type transport system involved in multi-copper enzyme maturation permease subunit